MNQIISILFAFLLLSDFQKWRAASGVASCELYVHWYHDRIVTDGNPKWSIIEHLIIGALHKEGYTITKNLGKYGSNNGFDGVYIKGSIENPTEIIIVESKQFRYTNGVADDLIEHSGVSLNQPNPDTGFPAQIRD